MPEVRSRLARGMFPTFVLFTAIAGQFWRNLLGWWGYGAVVALVVAGGIALLVQAKPDWMWRRFPKSLIAFLALATLSLLWSFYPGASAIGIALQWVTTLVAAALAVSVSGPELLRALGAALRWVIGLSLAFELVVAVFVREAVLPFWVDYGTEKVPAAFYWSRGLLLEGGPIEGIVANRNLLGFAALLAVIVIAVQLAAGAVRRGSGLTWLTLAVLVLVLTRSATVTVSAVAVLIALVFALWGRRVPQHRRTPLYLTAAASGIATLSIAVAFTPKLLTLLGKSDDLTGRFDIWNSVVELASQRSAFGWGWVSYWAPWVEPFQDLAVRKGVVYLQAHNAWLDVWLQLGLLGLIFFGALVIGTLWRSWFLAVDQPRVGANRTLPYTVTSLLPLLIMAALLAQSLAESRLLIESGWMLLVILAILTKRRQGEPLAGA